MVETVKMVKTALRQALSVWSMVRNNTMYDGGIVARLRDMCTRDNISNCRVDFVASNFVHKVRDFFYL